MAAVDEADRPHALLCGATPPSYRFFSGGPSQARN